ncbi:MAG: DivIVA domain-containing protein [Ruminococcaceae bacterium]|nr:DivIVA domain-containing protein [Oscillospiraceae bacterium]
MLTADEIRNITFSSSMKGYKREEVDEFLDRVEADYEQIAYQIKLLLEKNDELEKKIEESENAKDSIQNVLLSAQKLADQIVADAKNQAEEILNAAKGEIELTKASRLQTLNDLEREFEEKKAVITKDYEDFEQGYEDKKQAMLFAAQQSVQNEQAIYDRLKIEAAAFRSDILVRIKSFVKAVSELPEEAPMDAARAARAVELEFENNDASLEETASNEAE